MKPYENTSWNFDELKKGVRDPKGTRTLMNALMSKDAIREHILRQYMPKHLPQAPVSPEVEC
jgi:hypothetical protein